MPTASRRKQERARKPAGAIAITEAFREVEAADVVDVRLSGAVEVGLEAGCLVFFVPGKQVRVGPLTPDLAEKLSEELLDVVAEAWQDDRQAG